MMKQRSIGLSTARIAAHTQAQTWINSITVPLYVVGDGYVSGKNQTASLFIGYHVAIAA
jgi:hypothetical protein